MGDTADGRRPNLPPLALHVPEPAFRPGDVVDYANFDVPAAGAQSRPDINVSVREISGHAYEMVRVLDETGRAVGPWDPRLDPALLREMLREMTLLRAFDDRFFRAQRQGKTSFYMKSTGEEATSIGAAHALDADDMLFPSYRQQGLLIARGWPLIEMMYQIYNNSADRLKGRQLPVMYSVP